MSEPEMVPAFARSEHTRRTLAALRINMRHALNGRSGEQVDGLVELIEMLIEEKITDAIEAMSGRMEGKI